MAICSEVKYNELELLSDEKLCELLQSGNRQAEEILASRHHRLVRSCARPYFLVGGDTEDLLQEGMFGLISAMREYNPKRDASFRTFASVCIRHRLYTAIQASNSDKHIPLNESVPLNPSFFEANLSFAQGDPEVLMIDREQATSLLENTRKQLSQFEVKILGLYLDGLTYHEISERVGKSSKSVDNAVQRIRRKIERYLSSGEISKS